MKYPNLIIGISCYFHDSAISVISNDEILYAIQEERLSRIKNDSSFPINALKSALSYLDIKICDVSAFVFYEKPLLKFERIVEGFLQVSPKGFESFKIAFPEWTNKKFFIKKEIIKNLKMINKNFEYKDKIFFSEHHLSHLASSFYPSNFTKSLLVSIDGVGEIVTTTIAEGVGDKIIIKEELNYPNSLGLLYSAFTYFLGFKVNDGEYKMMGLAPYGNPIYKNLIKEHLIKLKDDGSFSLNLKYFNFTTGLTMVNSNFEKLFNCKKRNENNKIEKIHMDLASSIQEVLEEIVLKILKYAMNKYPNDNLCLSGGVALNCVANGKLKERKLFKNIWIQPAAGDAGGSLGAAFSYLYSIKNFEKINSHFDKMNGSYLGPSYKYDYIVDALKEMNAVYKIIEDNQLYDYISNKIIEGKIVGWFQGRSEFGPRALGNRSILADPRNINMQKNLNLKTKFRESFRPFAPAVLEEFVDEWFEFDGVSPYMLFVGKVKKNKLLSNQSLLENGLGNINNLRSVIPAVTHVDNSARIQTVNKDRNFRFYSLIKSFYNKTKIPILINTSFNTNDEPIVNSPIDAYKCFLFSNIDILVIENFVLNRNDQFQGNFNELCI